MDLTAQIPDVTVGRAANAPHYEYMTTFGKRTVDLTDRQIVPHFYVKPKAKVKPRVDGK